ncbi:uncharacterized protein LOC130714354 [Lotus japonicus]|uniref:uncharacterized protein LOC130714354 n=1 Tax=Lotus japonicus TaxID=34305 RepID=UPI002589EDDC|nr:uncharacterized protein LOC130714354 [Lotus japonicus]
MGESCNNNNNNNDTRKRVREDNSEADSPESKLPRLSSGPDVNSPESGLARVSSGEFSETERVDSGDAVLDSAGVNEIQDDLLNMLDDADNAAEREPDTTVQGLDSVIRSFEEEILAPDQSHAPESGDFNPNLGYLLEASDDELGLPPTVEPSQEAEKPETEFSGRVGPDGFDWTGFLGFEDDLRGYEAFGMMGYDAAEDNSGGYVTIDGLFDYAEPADILWRSESLQAM